MDLKLVEVETVIKELPSVEGLPKDAYLYRYMEFPDHFRSIPTLNIDCLVYQVIKFTPCGYWITRYPVSYEGRLLKITHIDLHKPRWVANTGRKRFAYPDKESALNSFYRRKRKQSAILEGQFKRATLAAKKAKEMLERLHEQRNNQSRNSVD